MNVAAVVGGVLALYIAVATFASLSRRGAAPAAAGRVWRLLAFAATVGIAVALSPFIVADSGAAAAGYLLGMPVATATVVVVADLTRRAVGLTTTVGALVLLGWGLVLGLGIGLWFVLPALLLGFAALATVPARGAAVSSKRNA